MLSRIAVVMFTLVLTAPLRSEGVSRAVIVTPALHLPASHMVADALAAPFPDTYNVRVGDRSSANHRTLKSCHDYLPVADRELSTGSSSNDTTLRSLGVDCVALAWIQSSKAAVTLSAGGTGFRGLTVAQLPPQLALQISNEETADADEASRKGKSILAMEPGVRLRVKAAGSATLLSADWTELLTLYASGDLVGDGGQQLLVRVDAKVVGGSYSDINLYLLERRDGRLVMVRRYPPNTLH